MNKIKENMTIEKQTKIIKELKENLIIKSNYVKTVVEDLKQYKKGFKLI